MYNTKGFKSKEEKEKEKNTLHIHSTSKSITPLEMSMYATSIGGIHNSTKAQKKSTKGKGKTLKNASRKATKIMLKKESWD